MVEWTGDLHDQDACPPGCAEEHNFCYVRIAPSRTTATQGRDHRRRLDLAVDLRECFRVDRIEDLLQLSMDELKDAWLLLEPREDEGGV